MTDPMYDSGRSRARHRALPGLNWTPKSMRRDPGYRKEKPPGSVPEPRSPSLQARLIAKFLRRVVKPRNVTRTDIPLIRTLMGAFTRSRLLPGIRAERVRAPVPGEWLHPPHPRRGRALLYFHGGGYICGSPRTHRAITARLARLLQVSVFVPDYRLAPEHPYPAALQDAHTVWRWLLGQGYRSDQLLLAGDSAGGGLALALMQGCRTQGLPLPRAAALFSPWTDLTGTAPAIRENARRCAWFTSSQLRFAAALYAGHADPALPDLSPLHGDLGNLPPLILHVSDAELLRDDSLRLAHRARAAGTPVDLKVWHGLPHAWPNFAGLMPEADQCLSDAAAALGKAAA
jgi:monoterpene epsilon-lactone hydrolase